MSIESTIWSVGKKGRGPDPLGPSTKCAPAAVEHICFHKLFLWLSKLLRSTDFYLWVLRARFGQFGRRGGVHTHGTPLLNVHLLLSSISRINTILLNHIRGYLVGPSSSKEKCFICFNGSPLKMAKNVFLFHLESSFSLKIFKFLHDYLLI